MIIYKNTKAGFINDIRTGYIADIVKTSFEAHRIPHNNTAEYRAWHNSLMYICNVIDDDEISDDVQIAIEYQIPLTAKRIDFLIAGADKNNENHIVPVELKQWEDCTPTSRPNIVIAYTGGAKRAVCHPSYQADSYAKTMAAFNESILENKIDIKPCVYLHNFKESNRDHIAHPQYQAAIALAPIFLSRDAEKLRDFIKLYVVQKSSIDLLTVIDQGKLRPAKVLQDSVASMLKGNEEFVLIDEQKVAYETVKKLVINAVRAVATPTGEYQKCVVIISGGPGTGKSVVAIKLLCDLIGSGFTANYVTKNAAPRNVYFEKLRQEHYSLGYIKNLFKSSDFFWDKPKDLLDCIIVDEAHRLKKKSNLFHGENQIKEIINAGKVSVFFIDEDQRITSKDLGSKQEIRKWARFHNAKLIEGQDLNLVSQFRCSGSDGYLSFLDNLLGIRESANYEFDFDYDVKLFDSPTKMREALQKHNEANNRSRMIAGYCYEWISKDAPRGDVYDIVLEDGFQAKWNFEGTLFAIDPDSFDQVGCIHTTQGLEFEYCGIIIGKDLRYENGQVITDQFQEAQSDKSSGIRACKDPALADILIRNTYKTLLSRGQKGCYIYCEDKALLKHMSAMLRLDIIY